MIHNAFHKMLHQGALGVRILKTSGRMCFQDLQSMSHAVGANILISHATAMFPSRLVFSSDKGSVMDLTHGDTE